MPDSTLFNAEVSVTPGSIPRPPLPQLLRRHRPSLVVNTSQPTERPLSSTNNPDSQKTVARTNTATASRKTKSDPNPSVSSDDAMHAQPDRNTRKTPLVLSGDAAVPMPDGESSGVDGSEVRPWVGKVNISMGKAGCDILNGLWWLVLVAILGYIAIVVTHIFKET
ncbi:hypothetical protein FMEXI_10066 [Fusarium mexicanum]|uniref:Uncharacterized protein n=1 Tax=Fusarium mexicanum TaxID=751941 RepID=A0A8H5IM02_9HYPO|nr:hypothetical protein FMEXI_10066 [Fusarium mexicanum]